jgi:dTMP kinase
MLGPATLNFKTLNCYDLPFRAFWNGWLHKPSPFHYTHFSISQGEVCLFITFEGIEGCGKTTQIKRLTRNLQKEGIPCRATLEPGGTAVGRKIRRILLDSRNKGLTALAELMLYEADRAQHVEEVIKPALERNLWVVSDRFFDATVVYQGFARGQDRKLILDLNKKAAQGLVPDLTFLLDCPVEVGLARATSRNNKGQDRFEQEKIAFHRKVREGYLELARKDRKRFAVVDATQSVNALEKEILECMRPFMKSA